MDCIGLEYIMIPTTVIGCGNDIFRNAPNLKVVEDENGNSLINDSGEIVVNGTVISKVL